MMSDARAWLEKIHALEFDRTIKIMNVCGGHERSITHAGLRGALPKWVELVPGPGCPVCICPEEDVYQAIQLALQADVILVAFGDMLRVPVNVPKGEVRSQWHHVIDIAPTVLEAAKLPEPKSVNGTPQTPTPVSSSRSAGRRLTTSSSF